MIRRRFIFVISAAVLGAGSSAPWLLRRAVRYVRLHPFDGGIDSVVRSYLKMFPDEANIDYLQEQIPLTIRGENPIIITFDRNTAKQIQTDFERNEIVTLDRWFLS